LHGMAVAVNNKAWYKPSWEPQLTTFVGAPFR